MISLNDFSAKRNKPQLAKGHQSREILRTLQRDKSDDNLRPEFRAIFTLLGMQPLKINITDVIFDRIIGQENVGTVDTDLGKVVFWNYRDILYLKLKGTNTIRIASADIRRNFIKDFVRECLVPEKVGL
ncbi:hypothetical protein LCGC14_0452090 [marine sediment metagenome]|uniref:Uncharacterized protein n=1 Tax=marine sediment metagenome TaxID=412755 RepID=A0A0F9VRG0_9ZZZZ